MKCFLSYRHTGENPRKLSQLLDPIVSTLKKQGHHVICTFFDEHNTLGTTAPPKDMMAQALRLIDTVDVLLVLQDSPERSEGMLMEVGYCIAKNIPVIVATRSTVSGTYLPSMADAATRYDSIEDLTRWLETEFQQTAMVPKLASN